MEQISNREISSDDPVQDDEELITPFFFAFGEIVKIYLDFIDLDLNKRNLEGNTAFECALEDSGFEAAKTLKMIAYHQNS